MDIDFLLSDRCDHGSDVLGEHELCVGGKACVWQSTCPVWKSGSVSGERIVGHEMRMACGGPGR